MKIFKFENNVAKESNNVVSMLRKQKGKNEDGLASEEAKAAENEPYADEQEATAEDANGTQEA